MKLSMNLRTYPLRCQLLLLYHKSRLRCLRKVYLITLIRKIGHHQNLLCQRLLRLLKSKRYLKHLTPPKMFNYQWKQSNQPLCLKLRLLPRVRKKLKRPSWRNTGSKRSPRSQLQKLKHRHRRQQPQRPHRLLQLPQQRQLTHRVKYPKKL